MAAAAAGPYGLGPGLRGSDPGYETKFTLSTG